MTSRHVVVLVVLASCGDAVVVQHSGDGSDYTAQDLATPSRAQAARFLQQATFGPTDAEIANVQRLGYAGWVQAQLAQPSGASHLAYVRTVTPPNNQNNPLGHTHPFVHSFWTQALTRPDQLRQRLTYAWSQILVVSSDNGQLMRRPAGLARYYDQLSQNAFGSYREMLEDVSLSPMMGIYLSHLKNQKADPATGRMPDENFAREIMQLFSIGLYRLNPDGTPKLDADGRRIETYDYADIQGLARVFTGWSWACTQGANPLRCFIGKDQDSTPQDRDLLPMQSNAEFHTLEEKRFLGLVIPAGTGARPSLELALDALAAHPNVGPFLGRELIQRLVTSNPSPQYVHRVTAAFAQGQVTRGGIVFGTGVRGDLAAVTAAVLLDPEARATPDLPATMKLKEPLLRAAAWMRAFNLAPEPDANDRVCRVPVMDSPVNTAAQTPLRAPSVFNFYRPGYVPGGTAIAAQGLVAPEMQITDEVTVAGYANWLLDALERGVIMNRVDTNGDGEPDEGFRMLPDYTAEALLADDAAALVDRLALLLAPGRMSLETRNEVIHAVESVPVPVANPDAARLRRVKLGIFLTMMSPDSQVQ